MENSDLFFDLSEHEMLAMYKTMTHLTEVRRDCVVERDDGIDLDAWLTLLLQKWYAELLTTAPVEWLPVEDVSADVTVTVSEQGVVTATVPSRCVRPVEWRLAGWRMSVTSFLSPQDPQTRLQLNPWTRGNTCHPAAIDHGNQLVLYSVPPETVPVVTMARCVVRPADGHYRFHQAALSTLPSVN